MSFLISCHSERSEESTNCNELQKYDLFNVFRMATYRTTHSINIKNYAKIFKSSALSF